VEKPGDSAELVELKEPVRISVKERRELIALRKAVRNLLNQVNHIVRNTYTHERAARRVHEKAELERNKTEYAVIELLMQEHKSQKKVSEITGLSANQVRWATYLSRRHQRQAKSREGGNV
jgi:hypothetical protein